MRRRSLVVTGGSRGIGAAIVREALSGEWNVTFCAREISDDALALVESAPDRVRAVSADVGRPKDMQELVLGAVDAFGDLDAVIANAGISLDALTLRMPLADWDTVLGANLMGSVALAQAAITHFLARGGGSIVLVSSISRRGARSQASYATSKAALEGLSSAIAHEFAGAEVACNVLVPGYVRTRLSSTLPDAVKQQLESLAPLRRSGGADELARAALYLAGMRPARLTGRVLEASGGLLEVPA